MPFMNITVIHPLPDGTPIYDVSEGVDKKKSLGFSKNWSTRWRVAQKGGCPSWIDQIVVGRNKEVIKKTKVRAHQAPAIASSSKSSRDVIAINLDAQGNEDHRVTWQFVYVPVSHDSELIDQITGQKIPVADEVWFSSVAINDPRVMQAEAECNHTL